MSVTLETGATGAKRISWEHDNPRELLLALVQSLPDADEATLARHMRDHLLDGSRDCLLPLVLYFVRNTLRSLQGQRRQRSAAELRAATEATKALIVGRLLDLIAPNGKKLAQCTGADCRKIGGWYGKLADKVPPQNRRRGAERGATAQAVDALIDAVSRSADQTGMAPALSRARA
jgi:hypothetical protein